MLLPAKLWLRLSYSSVTLRKTSWHKEAINVKKKSIPSPLVKQMAITQLLMVLLKICKCHFVQHVILIQMVHERSCGDKMANH